LVTQFRRSLLCMDNEVMRMIDFTVVCDAPTGSVFDLARRITPERYIRVAGYWWWGANGSGLDPLVALSPRSDSFP
jgi:hypothetical protein